MQRYYPRMSLRDRIATPEGKRRYVRALFATIADRYDFITVALSYGQDLRWKRRLIELGALRPGSRALDLAAGTGAIAFGLASRGARVVGLDITLRMLELAVAKNRSPDRLALLRNESASHAPAGGRASRASARFVQGDMLALPFPPASFDIVTTGYGLRN